jgi:hypothetical protein
MLQVRQRELHFGEGEMVIFRGRRLGHPARRWSLKKGIFRSTPSIEFIIDVEVCPFFWGEPA